MRLQRGVRVVFRSRDVLDDRVEQRLEVVVVGQFAVRGLVRGGVAHLGGAVDDRQVEQRIEVEVHAFLDHVLGQTEQQVGGFAHYFLDTRVGAVHLVDAQDDRELGLKGLAQHEAGLRQGAFGCIDEQHNAVDHRDAAFHFTAEVGVARGVDHVDRDAFRVAVFLGERAGVFHGRVLREDRDALLALEVVRVHDAVGHFLALVEHMGLLKHCVDQCGLAVVNVSHNCHITNIAANRHCCFLLKSIDVLV